MLHACSVGDFQMVQAWVLSGCIDKGALHEAVDGMNCMSAERTDIVRLLLKEEKVDVNEQYYGQTPLMLCENVELGKLLIDAGADVNLMSNTQHTAIAEHIQFGCPPMVKLLLDAGADPCLTHPLECHALEKGMSSFPSYSTVRLVAPIVGFVAIELSPFQKEETDQVIISILLLDSRPTLKTDLDLKQYYEEVCCDNTIYES